MSGRPFYVSLGWTIRDYAKRVWDNSGEDNVLFLAGGIAFNIMLAAVPFVLLVAWGSTYVFGWFNSHVDAPSAVLDAIDRFLPMNQVGTRPQGARGRRTWNRRRTGFSPHSCAW